MLAGGFANLAALRRRHAVGGRVKPGHNEIATKPQIRLPCLPTVKREGRSEEGSSVLRETFIARR